jgi:hypothetical protein
MSTPDALSRLKAANPAPTQPALGRSAAAQTLLHRLLELEDAPPTAAPRSPRTRRLPRGGLGIILAALVLGVGGALAATNQFGWWSPNSDTARYAVDPAVHVRTPRAAEITCHLSRGALTCSPARISPPTAPPPSGQLYTQAGTVQMPGHPGAFTRANLSRAITRAQAEHLMSSATATRFRRDLAAVPDSFFTEFRLAMRYQSVGGGNGRLPPPGIPQFLICRLLAGAFSCQDLNGDAHAPVGAGIYMALPARDWRAAPPHQQRSALMPPGISFTRTEYQLLIDLMMVSRVRGGSSSGGAAPRSHPARLRKAPSGG